MPNLQTDDDPYTGEVYESLDKRDPGRRIRIVEKYDGLVYLRYRYICIANPGDETKVGRRGSIRALTLDKRWKKVSH